MKKIKSFISILLVFAMLITTIPATAISVNAETSNNQLVTDLSVDFDYETKNGIKSAEETLKKTADGKVKKVGYTGSLKDFDYDNNEYNWIRIGENEFESKKGKLRDYLESKDEKHKYIYLDADQYHEPGWQDFDTIDITTDKVLDLNGHKIELYDKRNKVDTHERSWWETDKYWQSTEAGDHKSIMFSISNGATLTIIDSSAQYDVNGIGTGEIKSYGYMINPYKYDINYYTTRDLFWVGNGNLVIYGGTYQAGRTQEQFKKNFTWDKLKTCIGTATKLAVDVTEYVYGIKAADAAYTDLEVDWEKREKKESEDADNGNTENTDSTNKKTGEGGTEEAKVTTPQADAQKNPNAGRNQTIAEKQDAKNEEAKKKDPNAKPETNVGNNTNSGSGGSGSGGSGSGGNGSGGSGSGGNGSGGSGSGNNNENDSTAKKYDKNQSLVAAEKEIATSIVNKESIDTMVDGAVTFVDQLVGMFGTDAKSGVNQTIHGTVVHIGNNGTLVTYGGTFKGYGASPNVRNAVVEVTKTNVRKQNGKWQGGQAYIYGGTFEGYSGANIFNMVKANSNQYVWQYEQNANATGKNGSAKYVKLDETETQGLEHIMFENMEEVAAGADPIPVDTTNIVVRGGVFRNYYEFMNVAIKRSGDAEDVHFMKNPGTPGSVNLGVESFGEDLIRDGRIQIEDKYGDGALVLMDERRDDEEKSGGVYHYRLFCSENELRYNRYLEVYPNKSVTNSTHSFKLEMAKYGDSNQEDLTQVFASNGENIRGAVFNNIEKFFSYPIDDPTMSEKFYVMPDLTDTNVYGEGLDQSEVWYYNEPVDANGKAIEDFAYARVTVKGKNVLTGTDISLSGPLSYSVGKLVEDTKSKNKNVTFKTDILQYNSYRTNMKWFRYRIYRVDPLTRENISESDVYGVDEPLAEAVYGSDNTSLKCKLELADVEAEVKKKYPEGFKSGELYRIVFNVDEYMNFNYLGDGKFTNSLNVASAESTILFRCYSIFDDLKDSNGLTMEEEFTPIRWTQEPEAGKTASVEIVNGKAGQVDYAGDKIFDIYYQWWEVDENGKDKALLAGTTNVFDGTGKYEGQDKTKHSYMYWKVGSDGETYVNTVNPKDPNAKNYGENGLPTDQRKWDSSMIHAYTYEMTLKNALKKNTNLKLCLENNKIFETGTDACYIPPYMAGRNIRVKVIVVNCTYPLNYDQKQVFYSRTIKVPGEVSAIDGAVSINTDNPNGEYATYDKSATIGIEDVTGMLEGEYITSVTYNAATNSKRNVEFNNFKASVASEVPTAKFPQDFYPEDYKEHWIKSGNRKITARFETNYHRVFETDVATLAYEVEATGMEAAKKKFKYSLADITSGKYKSGKTAAFEPIPYDASVGFSYSDFTATNPEVASIDMYGKLVFGEKAGQSIITVKNLDGTEISTTVNITDYYDMIQITGIDAPVVGQPLDMTAEVPKDARYSIKEVYWTDGNSKEKLPAGTTAEYFHSYKVHVVVDDNVNCMLDSIASYSLTYENADGKTESSTGKTLSNENFQYTIGEYDYTGPYTISHKFSADAGALGGKTEIDKVFIEFPTEVREGDNVSTWKEQIKVYTYDGVELNVEVTQAFGENATTIMGAYGQNTVLDEYINVFVKGVQTGPYFTISIPEDVQLSFNNVQIFVNGKAGVGQLEVSQSDYLMFGAYDTLNISDGEVLPYIPYYEVKDFEFVVGEPVYVNDLLVCDDKRVSIQFTGMSDSTYGENINPEEYVEYKNDPDKGVSLTGIQEMTGEKFGTYDDIGIGFDILFDANGDGVHEIRHRSSYEKRVFAKKEDIPAKTAEKEFTLVVLDPEGNEAYREKQVSDKLIEIPELNNAMINKITRSSGLGMGYGIAYEPLCLKISGDYVNEGETVIVSTTSVLNLEVHTSDTAVYVGCDNAYDLSISVDGVHWIGNYSDAIGCLLDGLKPDTQYILYYKQGNSNEIYTKIIKTAKEYYGVTIGTTFVTNENTGNLQRDGWQYDVSSKTLTLKDLTLESYAHVVRQEIGLSVSMPYTGVIGTQEDITIRLIGNNSVKSLGGFGFDFYGIYGGGNVTIVGEGNLSLTGSMVSYGMYAQDSLYLKGTGTLTINNFSSGAFSINEDNSGKIEYHNGEIDYNGYKYNGNYYGKMFGIGSQDRYSFEQKVHNITIKKGNDDATTITESELLGETGPVHITPAHSYTEDVVKVEALAVPTAECTKAVSYYKSCTCGSIGDSATFTADAGSHTLVHYEKKKATCEESGWAAYDVCENCNYTTFEEIAPTEHKWVYHEEVKPTCTLPGRPAYDECENCGLSSKLEDTDSELWAAKGHTIYAIAETMGGCKTPGTLAHYACTECDILFESESGTKLVSKEHVEISVLEHVWSDWVVVKEATETTAGLMKRICFTDESHEETKEIPATGKGNPDTSGGSTETPGGSTDKPGESTDTPGGSTDKPGGSTDKPSGSTQNPVLTPSEQVVANKLGISATGTKNILAFADKNGISKDVLYVTDAAIKAQKTEDVKVASYSTLLARATAAKNNKITLKWQKVSGADGYRIYGNLCGKNNKYKLLKTVGAKKSSYAQSKLKKGKCYKYLVVAYKLVDGKQITIAVSKTVHQLTSDSKYGNTQSIKLKNVKKNKLTVKLKKSFTIKATEVRKGKKFKSHKKLAYESSNTKIAMINKNGKVVAKKKGTCYVYVYAHNGIYSKIKITVK